MARPGPAPRRGPHHRGDEGCRGDLADLDLRPRRRRLPGPFRVRLRGHLRAAAPAGRVRREERQEALVTASDLDWTIVRPARLTSNPATGRLRAAQRLKISIRDSGSRADVAQSVVTELEHGTHLLTAPT